MNSMKKNFKYYIITLQSGHIHPQIVWLDFALPHERGQV